MFTSIAGTSRSGNTAPQATETTAQAWRVRWLRPIETELLIIGVSVFFSIACNTRFWNALLAGRDLFLGGSWLLLITAFSLVTALHCFLLGLVITRRTAKPLLYMLLLTTAAAVHYMNRYTVFFDTSMLRNVLHTDVREARELLSIDLLAALALYGLLPALLVGRIRLAPRGWRRAALIRAAFLAGALAVTVASIALSFQNLSSLMRNHKELRYLVTPGNYLVSLARVLAAESAEASGPRLPVATDAVLAPAWSQHDKPMLLVLVVGETARAANWGLNGYARRTTPELAATAGVINFPQVVACGTNTETSLPCMFSPYGRVDYDEEKIRQHESLLHVLARAGFRVIWRDNQSGCKGVCDGLEIYPTDITAHSPLCDGEHCLDKALLDGLEAQVRRSRRNTVIVLHQLGNHGPAYFRRYPQEFGRFSPACLTDDLGKCSRQEIVNSYDNALLYTDHFLAQVIQRMKAFSDRDTAVIYASDHGESLGENGIYLHGLPYAIAPSEQKRVPMMMWMSRGFARSFGLNLDCLRREAAAPISHDYLFHSVLGMLLVQTRDYDASFDFTAACRLGQPRTTALPVRIAPDLAGKQT